MADPRIKRIGKKSPLTPDVYPTNKPKPPDIKPMYEKEWDDVEEAAGDALDKRDQKKKEDI